MKPKSRILAIWIAAAAVIFSGCAKKSDLEVLSGRVDSIEQKQTQDVESLVSSIQASITSLQNTDTQLQDYISVLQSRVASLEQSDEEHQAEIEALKDAVKILQAKDTDLQTKIDELKEYADGLVSGTKDWANATFVTLEQYNAAAEVIRGIYAQMEELSSKITATDETVAAHTALFESLDDAVSAMQLDISTIKTQMTSLLSRIQQVSYVPRYEDGKVHLPYEEIVIPSQEFTPGTAVLDFELRPSSVAKELETLWKADNSVLSVKAAYAFTKAVIETVDLTISSVSAEGAILNVVVSGEGLKDDFFNEECAANVRLGISDGNSDIISDYIPMVPEFVIPFTDAKFREWCVANFDRDGNGVITLPEAQRVTEMKCMYAGITYLGGIEYFSSLEKLDVTGNSLVSLNVSKNTALKNLNVSDNSSLIWLGYPGCTINASGLQIGAYVIADGKSGVVFKSLGTLVKIVSADETSTTWENAKTWCSGKGSAWYLPGLDELEEVYNNRVALNTTLATRGATQFNLMGSYWSSEEYTSDYAKGWSFSAGKAVEGFSKNYSLLTRAVRVL